MEKEAQKGQLTSFVILQKFFSTNYKVPEGKTNSGQSLHQENDHETQADSSVNAGVAQILPKVARREFSNQERDYALTRYKEKKKCRRYDLIYVCLNIIVLIHIVIMVIVFIVHDGVLSNHCKLI